MDSAKLNQFLAALRPELANVDWVALARKVLIENPQTAWRELPGRLQASRDLLSQYNPGGIIPNLPPTPPDVEEKLLGMVMDKGMAFAPMGITAYHGSRSLFSQLDPTKAGTGEGKQVYGHGAGYTAGARPVAESYIFAGPEGRLTYKGKLMDRNADRNTIDSAVYALHLAGGDKEIAKRSGLATPEKIDKVLMDKIKPVGYLYKGDIPDEIIPKFLDWDRPIKEQSKEVQSLAKKYGLEMDDLGGDLVARVGKGTQGSAIMEDAGIRGIKYFDANSRNAQYGSQNFIPFRAEDYKIQEINDIPVEDWISRGLL